MRWRRNLARLTRIAVNTAKNKTAGTMSEPKRRRNGSVLDQRFIAAAA
jgi:hypothetical protein